MLLLLACMAGCASPVEVADPPPVDRDCFEREVYPVLARDCGYAGCHGDPARFFRVFAPGRTRLDPATGPFAAATPAELDATFERARSMLASATTPEEALLLRKPLAPAAGGDAHMGTDSLGRDVYPDTEAAGWQTLQRWANGACE